MEDLLKALKLEPGGVYAIEMQKYSHEAMNILREQLEAESNRTGITFIVLGPNLKIARDDSKVVPCES